jgi:hypothetical protein
MDTRSIVCCKWFVGWPLLLLLLLLLLPAVRARICKLERTTIRFVCASALVAWCVRAAITVAIRVLILIWVQILILIWVAITIAIRVLILVLILVWVAMRVAMRVAMDIVRGRLMPRILIVCVPVTARWVFFGFPVVS